MSLEIGTVVGSYRIVETIGEGGMGAVYRARHLRLTREAAIKIIRPGMADDAAFRKRFEVEANSVAALQHASILQLWDYGEHEGRPYLVMPYIVGGTLKDRLARGPIARPALAGYVEHLGQALDHAHARGIVHRDVKPSNVLLDVDGHLYLADFGVATALAGDDRLTTTGLAVGTPEYMAPEQARGQADGRSDLYALGIILYQMVTGQVPFTAPSAVEVLLKHQQETLPLGPLERACPPVSDALGPVLMRALAKDPDARYQRGAALAAAVRSALEHDAIGGTETVTVIGGAASDRTLRTPTPGATAGPSAARRPAVTGRRAALLGAGGGALLVAGAILAGGLVLGTPGTVQTRSEARPGPIPVAALATATAARPASIVAPPATSTALTPAASVTAVPTVLPTPLASPSPAVPTVGSTSPARPTSVPSPTALATSSGEGAARAPADLLSPGAVVRLIDAANATWAATVAKEGRPLTALDAVYGGQWLAEMRASVRDMRGRGQYRLARQTAPVELRSIRDLGGGRRRIEAIVLEQWDDRLYNADGSPAKIFPGTVEQRYLFEQVDGRWLVVESELVRTW